MKIHLLSLAFLLGLLNTFGQPSHTPGGKISGQIIDKGNKKAIEYANISLFKKNDNTLVNGTITDTKGFFSLEKIRPGNYRLQIDFIGYGSLNKDVAISPKNLEINLGKIELEIKSVELSEVEVAAEKPMIEFSLDKKVVNVDKNMVTAGGSATDIMRTIPSVNVDIDGNISLRGSSNVNILIDGKPATLTGSDPATVLEQLPASMIESVEIITNPSAKYDPDGMAGILNIKTKKEKRFGLNGMVSANYGTWNKYGGSLNLNYRQGKINFFGSYNYRKDERDGYRKSDRTTIYNDTATFLSIYSDNSHNVNSHSGKLGFDYIINEYNSLTVSGNFRIGERPGLSIDDYKYYDYNNIFTSNYKRFEKEENSSMNQDISMNYKKTFKQKGRELTIDTYYSQSGHDETETINQIEYLMAGVDPYYQDAQSNNSDKNFTIQSDYVHPLKNDARIEAGFKGIFRTMDNDYVLNNYLSDSLDWAPSSTIENHFVYSDALYSGYLIASKQWKKFSFQAGVRAEQTNTTSDQQTLDSIYHNNYFSVFPSVHLSYSLPADNKLQVSYSRRINRPSLYALNPFVDVSDSTSIRYGNPYLRPEYVDAMEIGHIKDWKKISLTSSFFYKHITDIISRYRIPMEDGKVMLTFINVAEGYSYGLEFVVSGNAAKWLRLQGDFSYYKTAIQGDDSDNELTNSIFSYDSKLNATIMLPKNFSIQLSGMYSGPSVMAQAIRKEMYFADFGLKKDLFKRKMSISFRISDVFNTRKFRVETDDASMKAFMEGRRDSRIAYLTLSYRINEGIKARERRSRDDESDMDMDIIE